MKKKPSKVSEVQKSGGKKGGERKKKQYKVRNWKEYNEALVNRGKVTFWITDEVLKQWKESEKTGKRGKPRIYSNMAIETGLTIQQVFHLALRQTEGFVESLLGKLGSKHRAPDYSTFSIRSETVSMQIRVRPIGDEPLHIVADSTGVKVYGEGEWKVRQHGWSKHRTWLKLHIGVDEKTGDVLLGEVTGNDTADCEILAPLLEQLPEEREIDQVSTDGAYDTRDCYQTLIDRDVTHIAIPPQHNAKIWQHGNSKQQSHPRDVNLRRIRKIGRKQWKREIGYHRRSLAETTMFRIKAAFTDRISARVFPRQRTQLLIRLKALNRMTTLGMPDSCLVA